MRIYKEAKMECKIEKELWKKVIEEREKALFTGYTEDYVDAVYKWVNHIMEHGCWRYL